MRRNAKTASAHTNGLATGRTGMIAAERIETPWQGQPCTTQPVHSRRRISPNRHGAGGQAHNQRSTHQKGTTRMKNNRSRLLDGYGRRLLECLGVDPDSLPNSYNPITRALKDNGEGFVATAKGLKGYSKTAVAKAATACQMKVYDGKNGPDGDGKPKSIRRHWYDWFKIEFAHPYATALGEFVTNALGIQEIKNDCWEDLQSDVYGFFVDTGTVTYKDLWIEDASRRMKAMWDTLFSGCYILVAVEKNGLFDDFVAPATALGAKAVYSGAGKSSKAGMEKVLRDCFGWDDNEYSQRFSAQHPLIVLHISDHDFDGESVIGPTFGDQARRYTPHIYEARVGIKPEHILAAGHNYDDKWYDVKVKDNGYVKWAEEKALFYIVCASCGHSWISIGIHEPCPECGSTAGDVDIKEITPHGFEVEALSTHDYRALLVDALLQVLPFDYIVERLREECTASSYEAASQIAGGVFEQNADYQRLLAEFERLEGIKRDFEERVRAQLRDLGEPHEGDWQDDGDDPTEDDYRAWVQRAQDYSGPWRPFQQADRTAKLVDWLRENAQEDIENLIAETIEF